MINGTMNTKLQLLATCEEDDTMRSTVRSTRPPFCTEDEGSIL